MTHASLFSGIGGFDLAAQWAGFENLFSCEIDNFCRKVLKHHFPNATQYEDIKATDFTIWRGRINILTGGSPCQPFSLAGKRKGTEDDRHLWPEMLRAIREIQPRWVVGENVLGIINWSQGMVFEQVCADLEAEGDEVQPYLLPAAGVGAPHQRYRVWFVAHAPRYRDNRESGKVCCQKGGPDSQLFAEPIKRSGLRFAAHTNNERLQQQSRDSLANKSGQFSRNNAPNGFDNFPTQSPICSRDDGISSQLDGITFPKWRMESIKAYGNAIVPQVVYQIFESIKEYERL